MASRWRGKSGQMTLHNVQKHAENYHEKWGVLGDLAFGCHHPERAKVLSRAFIEQFERVCMGKEDACGQSEK